MKSKVEWSPQVENYVRSKSPEVRRALWQGIKSLADWNGREDFPRIRHLEDELSGYLRLRIKSDRVIFRESFQSGRRIIKCLFIAPRKSVYEAFQEILLDELAN